MNLSADGIRRVPASVKRRIGRRLPTLLHSFDVFDSAIYRAVPFPSDVFDLVAIHLGLPPVQYRIARIEAESLARRKAAESGRGEIRFDEIFDELKSYLSDFPVTMTECREEELAIERSVARPISETQDFVESHGGRQIFISDMYLSGSQISELLVAAGYSDPIVESSSDHMDTKAKGTLFDTVLTRLGVLPERTVHLGDNYHSDIVMADRAGLGTSYRQPVEAERQQELRTQHFGLTPDFASLVESLVEDSATHPDPLFRIGYEIAGPLLSGYGAWLDILVSDRDPDRVLLCARDSHGLAFHPSPAESFGPNDYFFGSRMSLGVPTFAEPSPVSAKFFANAGTSMPLIAYAERFGISRPNVETMISQELAAQLDSDITPNESPLPGRLYHEILPALVELGVQQLAGLERHLLAMEITPTSSLLFVDAGWHGSLQVLLAQSLRTLGWNADVNGAYIGLFDQPDLGTNTWLFNRAKDPASEVAATVAKRVEILEFLLQAPHGTTTGYRPDGTPTLESEPNCTTTGKIWAGAKSFLTNYQTGAEQCLAEPTLRLITRPTQAEATALSDLTHRMDAGHQSPTQVLVANTGGLWEEGSEAYSNGS